MSASKKLIILSLGMALASTTACSRLQRDDGIRFDGERFRIQAKRVSKDDRKSFVSTASPASKTMEGAREAAIYGGTRYCINEFGTSLIAWTHGPEDAPQLNGDSLVLEGQCRP